MEFNSLTKVPLEAMRMKWDYESKMARIDGY
jgi:hypothetical protein